MSELRSQFGDVDESRLTGWGRDNPDSVRFVHRLGEFRSDGGPRKRWFTATLPEGVREGSVLRCGGEAMLVERRIGADIKVRRAIGGGRAGTIYPSLFFVWIGDRSS